MRGCDVLPPDPGDWRHYDVHGLVRISTNVLLTTVPPHFRVNSVIPNFRLEMVDDLDGFRDAVKHRVIGFTTRETGNQGLYYESDVPVFSRIGTEARWRFLVQDLASETTQAQAAALFFLEHGKGEIFEISGAEAARRAILLNMEEVRRPWNSSVAQVVRQCVYSCPRVDMTQLMDRHRSCIHLVRRHCVAVICRPVELALVPHGTRHYRSLGAGCCTVTSMITKVRGRRLRNVAS